MIFIILFISTFFLSITIIRLFSPVAVSIGLVDKPGGRKIHQGHIPLVGGVAIYLSLIAAWVLLPLLGNSTMNAIFVGSSGLLFTIGLLDDRFVLSVKLRLAMQIVAALLLIYSKVVLEDFGYLLSDKLLVTGLLAVPITVIATVGVINSLNMIDGIDGLAGLVSVVILSLLLIVSIVSGSSTQALISVCVLGAVTGFLIFNLRRPGFKKATVFMGDAGSTLLGFMLAYLLISLSQGNDRAITPVVGLWIFALPLMDTLGVMIRRVWHKKSPFAADRGHLHHLLMDAGFRVRHAVYIISFLQLVIGSIGLTSYYLNMHDTVSFIFFFLVFSGYVYLIIRPWRAVTKLRTLHRTANFTVRGVKHIYVGNLNKETAVFDIEVLLGEYKSECQFEIYESINKFTDKSIVFAVINAGETDKVRYLTHVMNKKASTLTDQSITNSIAFCIRQYISRNSRNDRRIKSYSDGEKRRRLVDRRFDNKRLIYRSNEVIL